MWVKIRFCLHLGEAMLRGQKRKIFTIFKRIDRKSKVVQQYQNINPLNQLGLEILGFPPLFNLEKRTVPLPSPLQIELGT